MVDASYVEGIENDNEISKSQQNGLADKKCTIKKKKKGKREEVWAMNQNSDLNEHSLWIQAIKAFDDLQN